MKQITILYVYRIAYITLTLDVYSSTNNKKKGWPNYIPSSHLLCILQRRIINQDERITKFDLESLTRGKSRRTV